MLCAKEGDPESEVFHCAMRNELKDFRRYEFRYDMCYNLTADPRERQEDILMLHKHAMLKSNGNYQAVLIL